MDYHLDGIYYTNTKNKYITKWKSVYKKPQGIEKQEFTMMKVKGGRKVKQNRSGVGVGL